MSFVAAFATNEFVIMGGDIRRTYVSDTSVYYDDTPKAFGLNRNVLIGLTGDLDFTRLIFPKISEKITNKTTLEAVTRIVRKIIREHKTSDTYCLLTLAGRKDNGKMGIVELKHENNFKPTKIDVPKDEIRWNFIIANYQPSEWFNEEFAKLEEYTPDSIANLCERLIKHVADQDNFVSPKCEVLDVH
jgi:hypothetical protein